MASKLLPRVLPPAGAPAVLAYAPGGGSSFRRHPRPLIIGLLFLWFFLPCVLVEAAEIKGLVRLDGPVPVQEKLTIEEKKGGNHSTEGCGSLVKDSQRLQVDGAGGIKDVVVWVEAPAAEPAPAAAPVLIDQNQCVFEPHVVGILAGGEIAVRNSDSVIHNIRIFREGNPDMLMHQWQKADAADIPWRFKEPGRYVVRCGVHHWMYAWVFVAPGGFVAVTDEKGNFSLAGVPAGKHTLHVWHETLGTKEIPVEVGPQGSAQEIRFTS